MSHSLQGAPLLPVRFSLESKTVMQGRFCRTQNKNRSTRGTGREWEREQEGNGNGVGRKGDEYLHSYRTTHKNYTTFERLLAAAALTMQRLSIRVNAFPPGSFSESYNL